MSLIFSLFSQSISRLVYSGAEVYKKKHVDRGVKLYYSCCMQLLSAANKSSGGNTCAQEVLEAAPSLVWYIRLHMRKHREGLSVPQFRALVKVRDVPAVSLSSVADHLGASMPTASRIVGKLVQRGLLMRGNCA